MWSYRKMGGSGGGINCGTDVKVQATDNFSKGDTFVGTLISGVNPQVASVKTGLNIVNISADGNVALISGSITASSTTLSVYVNDSNSSWSEVVVNLPDMTGATSINHNDNNISINEDGSRLVASMGTFLLSVEIDINNKTASAKRIDIADINLSEYGATSTKINGVFIRGNCLIYLLNVTEGSSSTDYLMYSELTDSISNVYRIKSRKQGDVGLGKYISGLNDFGNNKVLFFRGNYNNFYRVEISQGKVVACNENNSAGLQYITRNGLYGMIAKVVYKINQETGTITAITTLTTGNTMGDNYGYIDESGKYYRTGAYNVYRIEDTAGTTPLTTTAHNCITGSYFDIRNGKYFTNQYNRLSMIDSEEAEYAIAHATSVSATGDIYGVVTEETMMGETKMAKKIFNR